ncbi:hypothetical protein Daus18300_013138 [Diaporthe australafricana]|uniref:Ankyrin repeat protein n=1 Tax=Diaporthe australafricana TaxID=127596 RepID=A0ABR3W0K7_9PEZI
MSNESTGNPNDPPQCAMDGTAEAHQTITPPAGPSSHAEPAQQWTSQATDYGKSSKKKKKKRSKLKDREPLHSESLSTHPVEIKLANIRAAIAAGADVNGLDESEPTYHREGRPLDACLRVTHMANGATFYSNVDVIKVLLEHGADPRLRDRKTVFFTPLEVAVFNAEKEGQIPRAKVFYGQVVVMFKEVIAKLEEKEKTEKGEKANKERGEEKGAEEEKAEEKGEQGRGKSEKGEE